MITIRKGMYETNSSSCHTFWLAPDYTVSPQPRIDFDDDTSIPKNGLLNLMLQGQGYGDNLVTKFFTYLYQNGVKEIYYNGKEPEIKKALTEAKRWVRQGYTVNAIFWDYSWSIMPILFDEKTEYKILKDGAVMKAQDKEEQKPPKKQRTIVSFRWG